MMRRQGAGPGSQVRNLIGGGGATMGAAAEDAEQEARLAKQRQYRLELEQQAIEKQERKRREKAEREALDRKHEEEAAEYDGFGIRIKRRPVPGEASPPPVASPPARKGGAKAPDILKVEPNDDLNAPNVMDVGGGGRRLRVTRDIETIFPIGDSNGRPISGSKSSGPLVHHRAGVGGILEARYQDPVVRGWGKEEQLQRLLDWERERSRERDHERARDIDRERERESVRSHEYTALLTRQREFDERCRQEEIDRAKRHERRMLDELGKLRADFVGQHGQVVSQLEDEIAKLRHATAAATAAAHAAAYGPHHAVMAGGAYRLRTPPHHDSSSGHSAHYSAQNVPMGAALPSALSRPLPADVLVSPENASLASQESPPARRAPRSYSSEDGPRSASKLWRSLSERRSMAVDAPTPPPARAHPETRQADETSEALDKLLLDFLNEGADLRAGNAYIHYM